MSSIIAIVGMPGSGKSLATSYLASKYQYNVIYFGGYILKEVTNHGLEINPENEKYIREMLRSESGLDVIAKLAYNDILSLLNQNKKVVIDGLYSFSEYLFLKQQTSFEIQLIAIHSSKPKRIERLSNRSIRPLNELEIEKRDLAEIINLEKGGPIAIADYHVLNDYSINELYENLDNIINNLK